jgi:hypothetical protein
MDVTGVNAVMVLSSFDTYFNRATNSREGLYKLTNGSSSSPIYSQTLKDSDGKDQGIGTLVYIFDASTSSGNVSYTLQHATEVRQPVNSSGTIVAIGLTTSESGVDIPYALKSMNSPVYTAATLTAWTPVPGLSTEGIQLAAAGNIYVSASLNGFSDGSGTGEWKLQYSSNQSTWSDIGLSSSHSFSGSQEYGISSLSWMVEDLDAGSHYFRVAHRQTAGTAGELGTLKGTLIACALVYEVSPGLSREFPSFALQHPSAVTSATSMTPVISYSIDPAGPTDLFLQAQYVATAATETDAAAYDLSIDQSILDGLNHNQYLPSSTYVGSGGSVGLGSSLQSGTTYGISLRHQTAAGTTLTTRNASLCGFQLSSVGVSIWSGAGLSPTTWEDDENWIGSAPGDREHAVIPGALTNYPILTGFTSCEDLQLETGASLTLNPASGLTVYGELDNRGTLEVRSDASGSGSLILAGQVSSEATGQVSIQSFFTADQWHIFAPPVSGQSLKDFLENTSNSIAKKTSPPEFYGMTDYDEATNSWNSYFTGGESGSLISGQGYLTRRQDSDGTVTVSGSLIASDFSLPIAASNAGWNAVGNPFSSAIGVTSDASTTENFLTTNLDQLDPNYSVLYLWDEAPEYDGTQNNYKVIGNAGYMDNHNYPELDMDYLQAGQGFLVKSISGGGSLLFTRAMQSHNNDVPVLKQARASWDGFKLVAVHEDRRESTIISFNEEMTLGLDPSYDAGLLNSKPDFSIYSRLLEGDQGINFKIQCLPHPDSSDWVLPLGVDLASGGEVSLFTEGAILPEQSRVYLEDRLSGQFTDILSDGTSYTLTLGEGGAEAGRLFLHIRIPNTTGTQQDLSRNQAFYAYYQHEHIILRGHAGEGSLAILYDMAGRSLGTFELQEGDLHPIPVSGLKNGLYLLSILDGSHKGAVKVFKNE